MAQARFTDLDSAAAYWDETLDRFADAKDWTSPELEYQRAVALGLYNLWGAGDVGVLAAIKAGTGFRLFVGEWLEETRIAACWGFYGDLARYYELQGKTTDDLATAKEYQGLARFAASAAQSSANALDRARRNQWDTLFLEYGGLTMDDLNRILEWANSVLKNAPDEVPSFRIGLGLGAVALVALVLYLR